MQQTQDTARDSDKTFLKFLGEVEVLAEATDPERYPEIAKWIAAQRAYRRLTCDEVTR